MKGLNSNLSIILVFAISLVKCDFVQKPVEETSSPDETRDETNLEVSGLNEEQVTQIAETLGYFAKIMMESTEKRKKKSARFGQKSAKFGQKSVKVGQKRAKVGQKSAKDGQKSAKVDQKSAKDGQKSAKVGPKSAKVDQKSDRVGLQRPKDTGSLNIVNVAPRDPPATLMSSNSKFGARLNSTLTRIRSLIIPTAIKSIEKKVAESNKTKLILAFWNFAGMVFAALRAVNAEMKLQNENKNSQENWKEDMGFETDSETDWNFYKWNKGNTIQFFAQLSYGYGYWGRYAIEMDESKLKCGLLDFEKVLDEYSRVTNYEKGSFDPTVGALFTSRLNQKIKEQLFCLISNPTYPKNKVENELVTYVETYTKLLSYIIKDLEKAPVT